MSEELLSRQLLCVYAYFGNITECKYSILAGTRCYSDHRNYAVPVIFKLVAGTGHLVRATLDMRKSVIATAMRHFSSLVEHEKITRLLHSRVTEAEERVDSTSRRLALYRGEVDAILRRLEQG